MLLTCNQDRFLLSGFAVGSPASSQRRQQVRVLWDLNLPELHDHIDRKHRNAWWTWACGLAKNKSFFVDASVRAALEAARTSQGSAGYQRQAPWRLQFSPGGISHENKSMNQNKASWNQSPLSDLTPGSSEEVIFLMAVETMTSAICDSLRPSQVAEAYRKTQGKIVPQFLRSLNGAEVYGWRNGGLAIYWNNGLGHNITFNLRLSLSVPDPCVPGRKFIFL